MQSKLSNENAIFARMYKTRKSLAGWRKSLDNPKKFQPVMRCEYSRAFDENVRAEGAAVKCNAKRYLAENPDHAMAYAYLFPGLYDFVLELNNSVHANNDAAYKEQICNWLNAA